MEQAAERLDHNAPWSSRFPQLFATQGLDFAGVGHPHLSLRFDLASPPEELISNVRIIGLHEGRVVVCSNDLGWRFLPGGTREPGERVEQTAERELLEEAGAVLCSPIRTIGAFAVHNSAHPYRPHLPHPDSFWLYVSAEVEVRQPPTNPADAEQVTEVLELAPQQAVDYLAPFDPRMSDTLRLFLEMSQHP